MKTRLFTLLAVFGLVVSSCYDDTELRSQLADHEERIYALEQLCDRMNTNIEALQTIVTALQDGDYITSVTPIHEGGVEIGYVIEFSKSGSITVFHGKDGADGADGVPGQDGQDGENGKDGVDGVAPIIGVKQDADGLYYWTLNGEWLLDENGEKIPTSGRNGTDGENGADGEPGAPGEDGKDGITPQLKIEDGMWYVSYDNGKTWVEVGQATGDQGPQGETGPQGNPGVGGDSMFTDIDFSSSQDFVIFTLSNGFQIKVPTWVAFETLQSQCAQMNANIEALQAIVTALQNNDYVTNVTPIYEGTQEIGYIITFSKSGSVTIYHGKDGKDGKDGADGADGKPGADGQPGAPGQDGADGKDGQDGADGNDGQDGLTPVIGVKLHTDGAYYWTLNGEWLLDANGNMVRASGYDGADGENGQPGAPGQDGEDGKDGQDGADGEPGAPGQDGEDGKDGAPGQDGEDGITPRLKIEDDYWYVSYDNGLTWELLGKAVGEDGKDGVDGTDGKDGENGFVSDAVFESVQVTATAVKFVLPDGQTFEIPMFQKAALIFDLENQEVPIRAGETIRLSYRLENSNASTVVSASSDGNYKACVIPKDHTKGIIEITSPAVYVDGFINVIVTDGENYSYVKVINVYEKGMHFVNGYEYAVPSQGRHLRIPFSVNFGYSVQVDGESQSWVSLVETKASYMDDQIDLIISRNDQTAARRGVVYVYADNNRNEPYTKIIINQESAVFGLEKTTFVAAAAGETLTNVVVSTSGLYFDESQLPGWLDVNFTLRDDERTHDVTMTVAKNVSTQNRSCTITCYADDKITVVGEMKLVQLANDKDMSKDMVLKVRTNFANDFTCILPIKDGYYTNASGSIQLAVVDCYVDWGDGIVEHIKSDVNNIGMMESELPQVIHRYEGLTEPKTFEVRISGLVEKMSVHRGMTDFSPAQSSITEVVQWGNLGVKDMSGAFYNNVTLKKIPSDRMYSFSEVESFSAAFANCTSLEEIPENLFVSATKARGFDSCFYNCSSLKCIPANLFAACKSATGFTSAFCSCSSLTTISAGAFENLSNVLWFNDCFEGCAELKELPEGMFSGCTSVESFSRCFSECWELNNLPERIFEDCGSVVDFSYCFYYCGTLKELPIDLFNYSPNISTVAYCFYNCYNLSSIPVSLFDNNRRITDFGDCFQHCNSIDIESPYTVINGKKWHLYERVDNPDYFVAPVNYERCFGNCYNFTDIDQIPDSWK